MRGQIYILIAVVIAIALASVANVLYFTSLPVESTRCNSLAMNP